MSRIPSPSDPDLGRGPGPSSRPGDLAADGHDAHPERGDRARDDGYWIYALLLLSVGAVGTAATIDALVGGPGLAPDVVASVPRDRDPRLRVPPASNDVAAPSSLVLGRAGR